MELASPFMILDLLNELLEPYIINATTFYVVGNLV